MISIKSQLFRINWIIKNYRNISSTKFLLDKGLFHGTITYATDGLVTSNNSDFQNDPRFKSAYQKAVDTSPWENFALQWRAYIVCFLADKVKNLEGDFVECGVNTGAYSRAIIDYINFDNLDKDFYLFDTYNGLNKSQVTEDELKAGIGMYFNTYIDVYEAVKKTFSQFNRVKIIKGTVPETLPEYKGSQLCYLSIDMNVVEPEIKALHFFWDKVVKGGVIILDDYGFPMHIKQKQAFDQFAIQKGIQILCLPTGQGVIFK